MVEIYKEKSGFILITSVLIMTLLLLLVVYVVGFTITEMRISTSQLAATQTYYLAESGVAEAIWRIKNDWKNSFENNASWSTTDTRDSAIYPNGSYTIEIQNTAKAKGEITVTGYINIGGKTAQRVIKTTVYKALGDDNIGNNGMLTQDDINLYGIHIRVYNGGIFSNSDIDLSLWGTLDVNEKISAMGDIDLNWTGTINQGELSSQNYPPAPDASIPIPGISFDDPTDTNSYYSQADYVHTESQFRTLMQNNKNLTLQEGIHYVTGDVEIKGGQNLTINGTLVAEGNIKIGNKWCRGWWDCGSANVMVNKISSTTPSGILTKDSISFGFFLGDFEANGLIYASDKIEMISIPNNFYVTGAIIARKFSLIEVSEPVNILADQNRVTYTISDPDYSPVVTVEHWEEEY